MILTSFPNATAILVLAVIASAGTALGEPAWVSIAMGKDREDFHLSGVDSLTFADSAGKRRLLLHAGSIRRGFPVASIDSVFFPATLPPTPWVRLVVDPGPSARVDCPVSAALPPHLDSATLAALRLVEIRAGIRLPVPVQVSPGAPNQICWILAGTTPAGSRRTFELEPGSAPVSDSVTLAMRDSTVDVRRGASQVFSYIHKPTLPRNADLPADVKPFYARSGHIHPLRSPDGTILSDDAPADHLHHRAFFWAWTSTRFEGRSVNFWESAAKQGLVRHRRFVRLEAGPVFADLGAELEHVDMSVNPQRTALLEDLDLRVWKVGGASSGAWIWDFTSRQRCAGASPLDLLRFEYSGLGFRGHAEWKDRLETLTSEGRVGTAGHLSRSRWLAGWGAISGKVQTLAFLSHPSNARFPEPVMVYPNLAFLGYAPVAESPLVLAPGKEYLFRYRILTATGKAEAAVLERHWRDFAEPPLVSTEWLR